MDPLEKIAKQQWSNAVKVLLTEIWFKRNQQLYDKQTTWIVF